MMGARDARQNKCRQEDFNRGDEVATEPDNTRERHIRLIGEL